MVTTFPNPCLWRRSLCSNLRGIDPEKLYRATWEVSGSFDVVVVQNKAKKWTKKCAARANFANETYGFVCRSRCRRRLALHDFIFRLSKL